MKHTIGLLFVGGLLLAALSACATSPSQIQGTYVSPSTYASYNCRAIVSERNRVVNKVNELSGTQQEKSTNDAVATGVGVVLFWPALFVLAAGSDLEPQIASLKGHYEALTAAGTEKGCF